MQLRTGQAARPGYFGSVGVSDGASVAGLVLSAVAAEALPSEGPAIGRIDASWGRLSHVLKANGAAYGAEGLPVFGSTL